MYQVAASIHETDCMEALPFARAAIGAAPNECAAIHLRVLQGPAHPVKGQNEYGNARKTPNHSYLYKLSLKYKKLSFKRTRSRALYKTSVKHPLRVACGICRPAWHRP